MTSLRTPRHFKRVSLKARSFSVLLFLSLSFLNLCGAAEIQILDSLDKSINAQIQLFDGGPGKIFYGSVYEFYNDQAGMMRLALLRDAARHGNTIYLTVDSHGSKLSQAMIQYMESVGVHIRIFNPITLLRPKQSFYRNHEKVWTDGETVVVIDSNEGNGFWGLAAKNKFKGFGVAIKGPAAQKAFAHERELFSSKYFYRKTKTATPEQLTMAAARVDQAEGFLKRLKKIDEKTWKDGFEKIADEDVEFVHDQVQKKGSSQGVDRAVLDLIERAQPGETVFISAPYLILPIEFQATISAAIGKNVRIEILTNSWKSNDKKLAQARYLAERKALLAEGIKLWEYNGPETLHMKGAARYKYNGTEIELPKDTFVIEAFTGSFQPHTRGATYDLEDIAIIKGRSAPAVTRQIADGLRSGLSNSKFLESDVPENVSKVVRCIIGVLKGASLPIRHLL